MKPFWIKSQYERASKKEEYYGKSSLDPTAISQLLYPRKGFTQKGHVLEKAVSQKSCIQKYRFMPTIFSQLPCLSVDLASRLKLSKKAI